MINVLSAVGLLALLSFYWVLVRFGDWSETMRDAEEEK